MLRAHAERMRILRIIIQACPLNPEHHLTPALSPTPWRRGRGHHALGDLTISINHIHDPIPSPRPNGEKVRMRGSFELYSNLAAQIADLRRPLQLARIRCGVEQYSKFQANIRPYFCATGDSKNARSLRPVPPEAFRALHPAERLQANHVENRPVRSRVLHLHSRNRVRVRQPSVASEI